MVPIVRRILLLFNCFVKKNEIQSCENIILACIRLWASYRRCEVVSLGICKHAAADECEYVERSVGTAEKLLEPALPIGLVCRRADVHARRCGAHRHRRAPPHATKARVTQMDVERERGALPPLGTISSKGESQHQHGLPASFAMHVRAPAVRVELIFKDFLPWV